MSVMPLSSICLIYCIECMADTIKYRAARQRTDQWELHQVQRRKVLHPRWINMFHSTTPTGSLVALQKKEQLASESEMLHCISAHAFGLLARFLVPLAMKHAGQCLLKAPKTAKRVCMTNAHRALGPTRHFWTSNFKHIRRVKAKVGL